MQRRKFLVGMGSLAAGSAAAMGTGAFSSVRADRGLSVGLQADANAKLRIQAEDTDYASQNSDGQITIDFGSTGLNYDARTWFTDVLRIQNQGDEDVFVSVDDSEIDGDEDGTGIPGIKRMAVFMKDGNPSSTGVSPRPSGETRIDFTQEEGGNAPLDFSVSPPDVKRTDTNAKLSPGESALLSFIFITNDDYNGATFQDKTITIGAAAD